jgi:uncharacterized membrane protein
MYQEESDFFDNKNIRLAGDFAKAIFGILRRKGHHKLSEAGLDPFFLEEVDQALKPDGSAYVVYVSRESQIDALRLIEILEGVQGDLYHTTFPHRVEEALLKDTY